MYSTSKISASHARSICFLLMLCSIVFLSAGCSGVNYTNKPTVGKFIDASKISVVDRTVQRSKGVYISLEDGNFGRFPSESVSKPPLSKILAIHLEKYFKPNNNVENSIEIAILNGDLLQEVLPGDSLPFISIAVALSNRNNACNFEVEVKVNNTVGLRNIRVNNSNYKHWIDTPAEDQISLIDNCINQATDKIDEFIADLSNSNKINENFSDKEKFGSFKKIEMLKQLFDNGAITADEYRQKKKELLNNF